MLHSEPTFLDHAATTPLDDLVRGAMEPWVGLPLNPSSVHRHGQAARGALERARERVAVHFGVAPRHVVFTSGATEANNLVLRSQAEARRRAGAGPLRVATSLLEHACIRETCRSLERAGLTELHWMTVQPNGRALPPQDGAVDLLCLMAAQNETGVVQPLAEAREWVRVQNRQASWLCDITQAAGLMELNLPLMGAEFASLSAHKIYGPAGVGALVGTGVERLAAQITGGPQENEHRAGTQAVALVMGLAEALDVAAAHRAAHRAHLEKLAHAFLAVLRGAGVVYSHNGGEASRLSGFLNLSFPGFAGADLVIALDARGFSVSSGAACATGVIETSAAMAAMFPGDAARATGALRITPGRGTSEEAMVECARALATIVGQSSPAGRFARRAPSPGAPNP